MVLLEKAETVGGTTALSGGVLWLPNNHHMAEAGIPDSREDALGYLESLSLGVMDADLVGTFVDTGPEMLRYMEANTPLHCTSLTATPTTTPRTRAESPTAGAPWTTISSPSTSLGPGPNA